MAVLTNKKVRTSLGRYFDVLASEGYCPPQDTRRLLALTFILEWLDSDIDCYATECDYNIISKAVRLLSGDCLIPYGAFCSGKAHSFSPCGMCSQTI